MKFCSKCGQEIDDNAIFCHRCGNRTNGDNPTNTFGFDPYGPGFGRVDTAESKGIAVLSFLFWQVGVVLWFLWRHARPGKARSAMKGTFAGACFNMPVIGLITWFLWRGDSENRDLARIGAKSAIAGAVILAVCYALLILLVATGFFQPVDIFSDFFSEAGAAFMHLGLF